MFVLAFIFMARFIRVNQKSTKKPACWIFRYNFADLFREIKKSIWPSGLNCGRVLVTLSKQIILLAKKLFYKHEEINNFLKAEKPHFNVVKCFLYHICCSSFNNIIISRSELNTNNSGFRRFLVNLYKNILVFVR